MSLTKDQIAAACERAKKKMPTAGSQMGWQEIEAERIGYDAGVRAATEYWFERFKSIQEIDTSLMTEEEINIGLSEYVDFFNQMKEALGHE